MFKTIATAALAITLTATIATAGSVWGTASDINGYWGGSLIFKTDLDSGATTILRNYTYSSDEIMWFGDIAHSTNGWLYATAYEYSNDTGLSDGFDQLLKINPSNGQIVGRWDLGDSSNQINALTAVDSETLYGVEGGGLDNANLVKIALDGSGDFSSQQRLGVVGDKSDGDIVYDAASDKYYVGSFWDDDQPVLRSIDPGPPASGSNYVNLQSGYTSGLAFDNGLLWASNWQHMSLYTIDTNTGDFTNQYDLTSALKNSGVTVTGITGLSNEVPEPMTLLAVGSAVAGLGGYIRRRKQA